MSTTNRRYSLLEHLTSTRILDCFDSLLSLADSTSKAIEADFGQLSVLSLELRFRIYSNVFYLPQNQGIVWQLEWHLSLADVPDHACLREFVDNTDLLSTVNECMKPHEKAVTARKLIRGCGRRILSSYAHRYAWPPLLTEQSPIALRWVRKRSRGFVRGVSSYERLFALCFA